MICENPDKIVENIRIHGSTNPLSQVGLLRVEYNGQGFENWTAKGTGDVTYKCSKGSEKGQNKNFHYCSPYLGGEGLVLKKEATDEEGNIVDTGKVELNKFILDERKSIEDVTCKALG